MKNLGISERRACRALKQNRSTQRYESKQPAKDRELITEIHKQVKRKKTPQAWLQACYSDFAAFRLVCESQADLSIMVYE